MKDKRDRVGARDLLEKRGPLAASTDFSSINYIYKRISEGLQAALEKAKRLELL